MPIDVIFAAVAGVSFALALLLVPLAERFGRRYGFVDKVDPRKIHTEPKVRCGGLGIFLAFMLGLAACLAAAAWAASSRPEFLPARLAPYLGNIPLVAPKLLAILSGATLLFITGLLDDRFNLRPVPKLILQIVSAMPLIAAGITIRFFIPGELAGALLTIAWVVLLTNSFNFIDNMDGLSAGVAAVCTFNFYLISRAGGEFFMMGLLALLFGATLGFLRYNFAPARLFMGDSGSLFLGFMLAALSTMVTYYESGVPTQLPVVAPLVVLGVPIFDTASVMLIRWRAGKPLMQGDQNHFSHRMVALGFSRRDAVLFLYLVTFTVGLTAVNLRNLDWAGAMLALVQVVLFFVIVWFLEAVGRRKGAQ